MISKTSKILHLLRDGGFVRKNRRVCDNESIAAYMESIELFFAANDIATEKCVPVFLTRSLLLLVVAYSDQPPPCPELLQGLWKM